MDTRTAKGFTLIELLVVIAIIGILSAIGLVSLNGAREKARDAKRQSDIATVRSAMALYYDDNSSKYPSSNGASDKAAVKVDAVNGLAAFSSAVVGPTKYLASLPTLARTTDNGNPEAYWYLSNGATATVNTHFALASRMEGSAQAWYVLNDQGFGGLVLKSSTAQSPAATQSYAQAALRCTGASASDANNLDVCASALTGF